MSAGVNLGGSEPCHCRHHDSLDQRVQGIQRALVRDFGFINATSQRMAQELQDIQRRLQTGQSRPTTGNDDADGQRVPLLGGFPTRPRPADDGSRDSLASLERARIHQGINFEKVFDDKVALSEGYRYNGGAGGEKWRTKTLGYFVSKMPCL